MASTSETGHGKNVSNFESLITYCKGYGADYNPSEKSQTLPELQKLFPLAKDSMTKVNQLLAINSKAIEARQLVFKPLSPLTTRIMNALAASKVTQNSLDNANTHASKIKGERIGKKPTPKTDPNNPNATPPNNSNSVSQLSFDNKINNFEKLIETLKTEPKYNPNENELKVATLEALLANMILKNSDVIKTEEPLSTARLERNNILYNEANGLVTIAMDVKKYVKSVYSPTHPKYKQISGLAFKNIPE